MKRLLLAIFMLVGFLGHSQGVGGDWLELTPVPTASQGLVPVGTNFQMIYNPTTGGPQWRVAAGAWQDFGTGGQDWSDPVDANIVPDTDDTRDLGNGANRFANLNVYTVDVKDNVLFTPTDTEPTALEGSWYADDSENRPKYHDGTVFQALGFQSDLFSYLPLTGGTLSGNLSVPTATLSTHATTLGQVQSLLSNQDEAIEISTNTAGFNGNLSAADTDVQKALDTLDDMAGGGGDPDQTLSISGSESENLTISGTGGNTVDLTEGRQDNAGNMVFGNTEDGIDVTYDDVAGKLDFATDVKVDSESDEAAINLGIADDLASLNAMNPAANDAVFCKACYDISTYWDTNNGTVEMNGKHVVDDTSVDEANWTFNSFDVGDEICIYTNRTTDPTGTLSGDGGITFTKLSYSEDYASGVEQVWCFKRRAGSTEIHYLISNE